MDFLLVESFLQKKTIIFSWLLLEILKLVEDFRKKNVNFLQVIILKTIFYIMEI